MSMTEENLKAAFAGESQANQRYMAYAKKAEDEGNKQVAKLFRAAAEAERVHAQNHLNAMAGVKGTKENLEEAIKGETHEFTEMYPGMIESADKEGNEQAKMSFERASRVEKVHAQLYKMVMEAVESGNDIEEGDIFVCQVCGNTIKRQPPDNCPICGVPKERFKKIELI